MRLRLKKANNWFRRFGVVGERASATYVSPGKNSGDFFAKDGRQFPEPMRFSPRLGPLSNGSKSMRGEKARFEAPRRLAICIVPFHTMTILRGPRRRNEHSSRSLLLFTKDRI